MGHVWMPEMFVAKGIRDIWAKQKLNSAGPMFESQTTTTVPSTLQVQSYRSMDCSAS